jgi:hypothetical protein
MEKRFLLVMLVLLLAACGTSDGNNKKSAEGGSIDHLSAPQLVGQWMDSFGTVIEFYEDGRISGYSLPDFTATTYTIETGPQVLLNSGTSTRALALTQVMGCDGHAFAFVVDGAEPWFFVGDAAFDPVSAAELRAHPWMLNAGSEMEFQDGDKVVARMLDLEDTGTWLLENNQLTLTFPGSTAPSTIERVARCDGKPMVIVLRVADGSYANFLADPSISPTLD